eukprot:GHVP01043502.1.p1 GENE.GHVP01043502.1~~GHVP01043502.1.p1  ORF type:complete len:431 (-),score=58.11 GHVP01043502.1:259-1551(-)
MLVFCLRFQELVDVNQQWKVSPQRLRTNDAELPFIFGMPFSKGRIVDLASQKVLTAETAVEVPTKSFNETLEVKEVKEIQRVVNKYPEVFKDELGCASGGHVMNIETTGSHIPPQNPRRATEKKLTEIRGEIKRLLDAGGVRESSSPYYAPIVMVRKKNGKWRMCVYFRKLNEITVADIRYPMPYINSLLQKAKSTRIFSSLDIRQAFHTVNIHEDSVAKTGFLTPDGHYEFLRVPFGLRNSPKVFQRAMDSFIPRDLPHACVFIDDILIFSETFGDHLKHIEDVLRRLKKSQLTVQLEKFSFGCRTVQYLGHQIDEEGIRPQTGKIEAIQQLAAPTNVKELRSVLGSFGFYRDHIPHFADMSESLTALLKKREEWKWDIVQSEAFKNLKKALAKATLLYRRNEDFPLILTNDASGIGFYSKTLKVSQRK